MALAESERHLTALFELAPVAIAVTEGVDGKIIRVNAAFETLTGHGAEAIGRTIDALALWERGDLRRDTERDLQSGGTVRDLDVRLASPSGHTIDCVAAAERIDLQDRSCTVWLFHDITDRRRGERELVEAIDGVLRDAGWLRARLESHA